MSKIFSPKMNKLPSLSIFFPAFNEEENIVLAIKKALEIAPKVSNKFEVIVVNDGSVDNTAEVVRELMYKNKVLRLVEHKTNLGYGAALKSGFYHCKYDYITYMDSDNQFDFDDLILLIEKLNKADLVVGFRKKRADNWIRVLNGKLWNFFVSTMLGLSIKDIDCGFKVLKKKVLDEIPRLESNGATISAELLVKAKRRGFIIDQIGLNHHPRKFGNATGGNFLHIFRAFHDLITLLPKL